MNMNHTTPHISPTHSQPGFPGYYALIPCVLLILIGCIVAVVVYIRRRERLDELRHRLVPLYTYDPAEEDDNWEDTDREEEDQGLDEPLYKDTPHSFTTGYGT